MKKKDDVDRATAPRKRKSAIPRENYLSTGSVNLNLAMTGRPDGGFAKGTCFHLVGDSESGKTWLSFTCMAEAARNPAFADYRFLYDPTENGALMKIGYYFGKEVERRLEYSGGSPGVGSESLEQMYDWLDDAVEDGRPFIAVVDSMDAIMAEADIAKVAEAKKARQRGKEVTGGYGTATAKVNSARLRVVSRIKKMGSILIMISQSRENIGFGAQFNPKTYSGGKALKFYTDAQLWTSVVGKLKERVKGKDRVVGQVTRVKVDKNRLTGKKRAADIRLYNSHGIDDTGSMVDYLLAEGHWKKGPKGVAAKELDLVLPHEDLVRVVESRDLEPDLVAAVVACWDEIERGCEIPRKKRYE